MEKEEIMLTEKVSEDIICKDCLFRNGGGIEFPHYTKGNCEMYPAPGNKPVSILFEHGKCNYYFKDPNGGDK